MATRRKRRKANTRRRTTRRRTTTRRASAAPRRRRRTTRRPNTRVYVKTRPNRRRRVANRRRRNPGLMGRSVSTGVMLKAITGGLVGVTLTKMIAGYAPASLTGNPFLRVATSVAAAYLGGWLLSKFDRDFGEAAIFGGLMQAGSLLLNTFIPSLGSHIALAGGRGMGYLTPGSFPMPQNPIMAAGMLPAAGGNGAGAPNLSSIYRAY